MPSSLLVFDLDGTLVDTAPDLLASLAAVLPRHGFRAIEAPSLRNAIGRGARQMIAEALAHQDVTLSDDALDAVLADFLKHYEANIACFSRLYPGVEALLDRFAAAGWAFAVCTNKKEHLSRLLLEALGVTGRFAAICGGDTFAGMKPDPVHLNGTIAAAAGAPESAVMVGDSRTDRDAAHRASLPFIGVSFGYTPVPMAALGPDLLLDHYDALMPETASWLMAQKSAEPAAQH